MDSADPFRLLLNPRHGTPGIVVLPAGGFRRARREITAWPDYAPTPLADLPDAARMLDLGVVRIKDEAGRFGLGSFKALGGAYAVFCVLADALSRQGLTGIDAGALMGGAHHAAAQAVTVTCATDGNHGRSVAWGARRFGCRCVIFVHPGVSPARREAMAAFGAEVRQTAGNYDDSVRTAAAEAERHGWSVVSDTSWPGFTEIPREVMQGYRLMPDEAMEQWAGPPPSHVFIQAGVGGVAASVSVQLRAQGVDARLVVVEPTRAACLFRSAEAGVRTAIPGALDTIMAGLACGEPSLIAWQELDRAAAAFMTVPDAAAVEAMRALAPQGVVAGESGAAGFAALTLAARDGAARAALGLGPDSRVLLFNCEGATDPALYARLLA